MSNLPASTDAPSPSSPSYQPSPSSPTPKASSIEQSVKLFRVFESLRNGDTAAISKAIREQSAPSDNEEGRSSLSLPSTRTEGTSILHLAIQCAELPVIEFVLSNATSGADSPIDINGRDRDGNTPLHLAATLGRTPVVRMLLDQPGINDSITNYNGQTPLDLARTPDIFQQLQLAKSIFIDTNLKKIHQLVLSGDLVALEQVLQDGRIKSTIDVNGGELATDPVVMDAGGTLLHEAAKKKDVKLAQLLLLNGADPFRRDRKGKLPQDYTKDDRTRAILKRSPAAAAAQRGIQEKTILAGGSQGTAATDSGMGAKESREMKGYLKKWTNYTSGYKLRWFVLEDGVLSYYKHQGKSRNFATFSHTKSSRRHGVRLPRRHQYEDSQALHGSTRQAALRDPRQILGEVPSQSEPPSRSQTVVLGPQQRHPVGQGRSARRGETRHTR
jgi:ankyrin repeat protein